MENDDDVNGDKSPGNEQDIVNAAISALRYAA
jgi:hypothetical protein